MGRASSFRTASCTDDQMCRQHHRQQRDTRAPEQRGSDRKNTAY